MIDAVILCGGRGTRLRGHISPDLPKALVDINGRPFLQIVLRRLVDKGFGKVMLLMGDNSQALDKWLLHGIPFNLKVVGHITQPMGTYNAIVAAQHMINNDDFVLLNGDTYCDLDYEDLIADHKESGSMITAVIDNEYKHVGCTIINQRFFKTDFEALKIEDVFFYLQPGDVNWKFVDVSFYDIGTPEGLDKFRATDKTIR